MAARGGRAEVWPGWHSWHVRDARQAIRRLANQSDPARQLGVRSAARRETAATAEGCAASAGGRDRYQAERAPTRRETLERRPLRRVSHTHRSVGPCPGGIRCDWPAPDERPGRPADRRAGQAERRHRVRGPRWPATILAHQAARRYSAAVLSQAARLCPGAERATF